jgi:cytosine deaminase
LAEQFDLIIGGARLHHGPTPIDIGIRDGRIAGVAPRLDASAPREEAGGRLAFGGFVDAHIHLDKAGILSRCPICEGTLKEAIALTAKAKAGFTAEDIFARASKVVEKAILSGTNRMRSFVEVDPRVTFLGLEAIKRVKADYRFAIDIDICVFAQEGTTQEPETLAMLREALAAGADSLGGCPYTDTDPIAHVGAIFDLAGAVGVPVDFHADFDLDPNGSILPEIARQAKARGYEGKVSVGHVTKLSAMSPGQVDETAALLAEAGIAVTVLPATDLFLLGRDRDRLVPRGLAPAERLRQAGVLVTAATNNVLNPFTPFGDASLIRMANLYANVVQLARDDEVSATFDMVSSDAARLIGMSYGLQVGMPADIVLLDAPDPASAVREIAPAVAGWKGGVKTFVRAPAHLLMPTLNGTTDLADTGMGG